MWASSISMHCHRMGCQSCTAKHLNIKPTVHVPRSVLISTRFLFVEGTRRHVLLSTMDTLPFLMTAQFYNYSKVFCFSNVRSVVILTLKVTKHRSMHAFARCERSMHRTMPEPLLPAPLRFEARFSR